MTPLSHHAEEAFSFAFFAWPAFLVVFLSYALIASGVGLQRGWYWFTSSLARSAAFVALLFLWSAVANGVWTSLVAPTAYVRRDPIFDFLPFLPFGSWVYDPACGGHLLPGVTNVRIQSTWVLFALATWLLSFNSYRRLKWRVAAGAA